MSILPKQVIKELIKNKNFSNTSDVLKSIKIMFKDLLQEIMEAELEIELGYGKQERRSENIKNLVSKNYRNGYSKKRIKTQLGELEINIPRDRNGKYEPQIISKYSRNADGMEEKILSLYASGMSTRDISKQVKNLYDIKISPELVSKISNKIMPQLNEWQNRKLEEVYPFVFMDAINYKIRENHKVLTKSAYIVLGITMDGYKDILGIWIGQNEICKFWLGILNELKSRGIKDVYLFCVDGLDGFRKAINTVYPRSGIQQCIVHQIRYSMHFVKYKHLKEFATDLKEVYTAITEATALENLVNLKIKWGSRYPSAIKSWADNWDSLATFYSYPTAIRRIIYTTNIIEGINRQFRKVTKTKSVFPTDDSLRKILYLASKNIVKKWCQRYRDWDIILNHLVTVFANRYVI